MKTTFKKQKGKEIFYRDYKNVDKLGFRQELRDSLQNDVSDYEAFEKTFLDKLNKYAPVRKKLLRANHAPYMNKKLRKSIMKRSQLENIYLKSKTTENLKAFKKQKNFCSKLYKKERKKFYSNLNTKNITDNKLFWRTVKPFLADKTPTSSDITLVKDDKIISDEIQVSEEFNIYFNNAVNELGIKESEYINNTDGLLDPVEIAINKFKDHPSIKIIEDNSIYSI